MSRPPKDTLWQVEGHTIAKIEIVKRYAYLWATILGSSFKGKPLTYIDGFAGPGEYTNHPEGSPLAALRAIRDAREKANWVAGSVRLLFIEQDEARSEHLQALCDVEELPPGLFVEIKNSNFVNGILDAEKKFGKAFLTSAPLFVFVDPFGATGAPFHSLKTILSSPTSEVLINFDADGIVRIRNAGTASSADRILTEVFGTEEWKEIDWNNLSHRDKCLQCVRLYKKQLFALPNVDYAFAFEMGASAKQLDYFLIFASQSARGLEKMKEVMKEIDLTGSFQFFDSGQGNLFDFNEPELWIQRLVEAFSGRIVPLQTVERWILNETPFFTFKKSILKPAMDAGLIDVVLKPGVEKITRGTFPEDKVLSIRFGGIPNA